MIPITVYGRMMLRAPLTGARVFLGSVFWMIPLWMAVEHARTAGANGTYAEFNAALASMINAFVAGRVHNWTVPAWVDPLAWVPVVGAAILWLYATQRMAMLRVGAARPVPGPVTWVRNLVEWTVLAFLLPFLGLFTVIVGGVLGATVEWGVPYNFYDPPVLAEFFAVPVTSFGRPLWADYYGEPILVVLAGTLIFLLAGRFMALQAAFVQGDHVRGRPPRLSLLSCIVATSFVHYFTAVAILWLVSVIAGVEVAIWGLMLVHYGLLWCTLAAASGFAAEPEIARSLAERGADDEGFDAGGVVPDKKPGFNAGDDLVARLKDWESRRAA